MPSSPSPPGLGGPLPPASPVLPPGLPPTPPGPTWPGGGLWGQRTRPESGADFPGRLGRGNAGCSPPWSEPLWVPPGVRNPPPSQPPLRGAVPVWPPLFLPPQSPHVLLIHLGVPPVSLGIEVPPLVSGRHPSCGETRTLRLPTLPSWLRPLNSIFYPLYSLFSIENRFNYRLSLL